MSRDYKKPAPRTSSKKNGKPMLTGVFIGLFVGLAIALAVAFFINRMPSPFVTRNQPAPLPETQAQQTPKADVKESSKPEKNAETKTAEKPRFDFYTILPGTEEAVTEQQINQAAQQPTAGTAKDVYYLQVGAFQNEADADNLKAKLALLGVEASIQTASLPDKGIWHRVRVGPYANVSDLNRVRASLAQNGMESSLIKVHEAPPSTAKN